MIGMRVPKALFQDGQYVDVIVTGIEIPYGYREEKRKEHQTAVQKAEVLGLTPPPPPLLTYKEGGMSVSWAITAVGKDSPTERLFLTNAAGGVTVPDGIANGTITQFTLPEVFRRSEELRQKGKSYGYNFQRIGVARAGLKNGEMAMVCSYLHNNPNPVKDWDEGVTAYDIDQEDEKYRALVQEEKERLDIWKHDIELWNNLTEEEAKAELLEGIARRLGLFRIVSEGTVQHIEPEVGTTFTCKVKVGDKGYPDLVTIEKGDGEKYYRCITTNAKPPMGEDDVDYAQQIALALERKAMSRQMSIPGMSKEEEAPPF